MELLLKTLKIARTKMSIGYAKENDRDNERYREGGRERWKGYIEREWKGEA